MHDPQFIRDLLLLSHFRHALFLIEREEPNLHGLVCTSVDDDFNHPRYFWFPPDIIPVSLALHPTDSLVAVGCQSQLLLSPLLSP